jgi:acyl-CoA thioester hydrolase
MRRKVLWQDIDSAGHVNNANYLAYVSDCGFEIGNAFGWPAARMLAEGFAVLVRRMRIEYSQPAVLDDELEITTWFYRVRRVTAVRAYTITRPRDGALIARAEGLYAWVDLKTGAPCRLPARFLADFAPNMANEG